ncbi:hypothetical protein BBP40_004196 [Aspergillus hancockii]|nr:hypothetical protein BBP40_004196 [Aspergillus hancockii]
MDRLGPARQSKHRQANDTELNEEVNFKAPRSEIYPSTIPLIIIWLAPILAMFLVSLDMTIVATAIPRIINEFKSFRPEQLLAWMVPVLVAAHTRSLHFRLPHNDDQLFPDYWGRYTVARVLWARFLGGVFTDKASWRWCCYISLPVGGLRGLIIFFFFTAPSTTSPVKVTWRERFLQMELLGTVSTMAAVVCYLLVLQWCGVSKAWSSAEVIGTLIGFRTARLSVYRQWMVDGRARLSTDTSTKATESHSIHCLYLLHGGSYVDPHLLPPNILPVHPECSSLAGSSRPLATSDLSSSPAHYSPPLVACGLIYTFDIGTGSGNWIGYQIVVGVGLGSAAHIPIIVNQASVVPSDLSSVSAVTLFMETLGSAICVAAGEAVFVNLLVQRLPELVPNVDIALVVATGVSEPRKTFDAKDVPGIL